MNHLMIPFAHDTVTHDELFSDTTVNETPVADTAAHESQPAVSDPDLPAATVAVPYYPGDALRDSLAKGSQVRILYYGDSQVEGDRVTSLLRRQLREEGGGTGPGLISPVMPVMYTRSYVVRSSSNWKRYTLLDYRNRLVSTQQDGTDARHFPLHSPG